ncbi:MAG TPA: tRNA uridine-5-carboxymethylaminomethyl(34) synthesis GTPase MnmE [Deltaproteobacteria bacterium]|nr:tRNA uridine-5-carboxymethylaminomethyl(34) synthesis GTPase MnmE [Deltaproteobacteria bacterium]
MTLCFEDSIVAVATPPGEGGIGILRLSGPQAPAALAQIWRGTRPVSQFQSHRLYRGDLVAPDSGEKIDTALVVRMRAPQSYTGEEVVEIHAHGGTLLLNRLLEILLASGLRPAEPGEFTRRAFLNGKLDLLQAEAVGELIHAKSEAALRNARAQLEGRLSGQIERMRRRAIALLAKVEAAIDFPEEDLEIIAAPETDAVIAELAAEFHDWLEKFQFGRLLREGVRLALVGRPNVGKSSLLNRLLNEERAIVHHEAGTTRDIVEGTVEWEGIRFQLFDTAGIRDGAQAVEQEGIRRSHHAAAQADLILWVLDASAPLQAEDEKIARDLQGRVLVVANKLDLCPEAAPLWDPPRLVKGVGQSMVSAKNGAGLKELKTQILRCIGLETLQGCAYAFLNNARHRQALEQGLAGLQRARETLRERRPWECLAADLREAVQALEALLGKVSSEHILDEIFSTFCVGK